jgi:60 kDa SS-A/Ro ribonucleoprotein
MTRLNILNLAGAWRDGEDAAESIANELRLRRAALACLDAEQRLYEDKGDIAKLIADFVPKVAPERVAALAVEAREQMQLRRVPLVLVREMARHKAHRGLVAETLERVIQRADELCEFVAIYWKDGRVPLSSQVKKGLAAAFPKFDEHELARHEGHGAIKLRDVLFLSHAKPRNEQQAGIWRKLIWGRLGVAYTWTGTKRDGWD